MKVTLVDWTENPEQKIAMCAAICYDADTSEEANDRRVKRLMNVGHLATLRFAYATFKIEGVSRTCSHQLVRHPHLSYLQRSQRYCNDSDMAFVTPEAIVDLEEYDAFMETSLKYYEKLLESGVKKGDARFVLPQACTTDLYISGNFQAWNDFLKNRTDKAAQWEIRDVALEIQRELRRIAPNVFGEG